jgi:hypothetical protein
LDADGDPTDPTTPDSEFSLDGAQYADCAEERTTVTANGAAAGSTFLTLTGAETDGSLLFVCGKVASGPKPTIAVLYPKNLAVLTSGTASAGAAGTLTLAVDTVTPLNLTGCFLRTTGGTGGGGTGGANNQARRITGYVPATRVATVTPNWETTPDATTTYDVLLPEGVVASQLSGGAPLPIAAGTLVNYTDATNIEIVGHASIRKGAFIYAQSSTGVGGMAIILSHASGTSGSDNTVLQSPGFPAALADASTTYVVFPGPNANEITLDDDGNVLSNEVAFTADDIPYNWVGDGSTTPFTPEAA